MTFYYNANYSLAFLSISYIMIDVNCGSLFRLVHMNGASFFMLFLYFHLLRSLCYNSYYRATYLWLSGLFLLLLSILESFLGYILPFGQMSYWAAIVIMNILSVIPLIGENITQFIWCSSSLILNRIFSAHFIIAFLIVLFVITHISILHSISSSNPLFSTLFQNSTSQESSSYFISFWPLLAMKDFLYTYIWITVFSVLILIAPSLFSNCDNSIPASSIFTPIHILPEWYFLMFYSILRSFSSKYLGILCLLFIFLTLMIIKIMNIPFTSMTSVFRDILCLLIFTTFVFGGLSITPIYTSIQRYIISYFILYLSI